MNCNTARELTDEYLDGLLSDEQKREFEAHLDTCPECFESIQQMRQMLRFLSSMEEEELPEGFHAHIHERLQAAAEQETSAANGIDQLPSGRKWLKWGAGLAAAIVLLLSVRLVSQLGGLPGGRGALPDAVTEQGSSKKLSLQAETPQEPADELKNTADASDTTGEAGGGAPENADVPMMISAAAPEESAAYDANNAEEQSKMDAGPESQPVEDDMRMLTAETALSGEFNLYVSDTTMAYKKISVIAASAGMEIKEETEGSVVLQVTDEAQRTALYDGLAKLGRVEDLGVFSEDNTVTVYVIFEK